MQPTPSTLPPAPLPPRPRRFRAALAVFVAMGGALAIRALWFDAWLTCEPNSSGTLVTCTGNPDVFLGRYLTGILLYLIVFALAYWIAPKGSS